MTIRNSLVMSYDGKLSTDFGIVNVNIDSGMLKETFLPSRQIQEQAVKNREKRYFKRVEYEPLEFELELAFESTFDRSKLREVARWLCKDYYRPLWFSEDKNRIFYAMYNSEPELVHTGNGAGYITIKMRCDSAFSYSPYVVSQVYDFSENTANGTEIEFYNNGDVNCKPQISIEMVQSGDFSIVNHHNNGSLFKFTGLVNGETVYVDNAYENIKSDLQDIYRYDNFEGDWLEFSVGKNLLTVYGNALVRFKYRTKTYQ